MFTPQHRDFLAQHQELGVLRGRRTGEQHQPADQADEHQIEHPYCHKLAMLPVTGPLPQANPQVSRLCPFWNPTEHKNVMAECSFGIDVA